jgi:hypothetical protein
VKRINGWMIILLLSLSLFLVGCGGYDSYETSFDERGTWGVGSTAETTGTVADGVYRMQVDAERGIFWSTAGVETGDGIYSIDATQIAGTLDNGFGLMFMTNTEAMNFYLLEISGDGYVWIGRCEGGCETEQTILVGEGWFASTAVRQGLNQTNQLQVEIKEGNMIFSVNGQEVGRASDSTYSSGEFGLLVETLGEGGVVVAFDNFRYTPSE